MSNTLATCRRKLGEITMASSEFKAELQQECLSAARAIESPEYEWLRPLPKVDWIVFLILTAAFLVFI